MKSPWLTSSFHFKRRKRFGTPALAEASDLKKVCTQLFFRDWVQPARQTLLGFTSSKTIPPTSASAPATGGMK